MADTRQDIPPKRRWRWIAAGALLLMLLLGCLFYGGADLLWPDPVPDTPGARMGYEIVRRLPHDPQAYTQGLLFHDGWLYESTGLYGESELCKVDLESGEVLARQKLPETHFGEGLALLGNRLYQLTWKENTVYQYDVNTLAPITSRQLIGEGWGLTSDGTSLIWSDGSSQIRYLDPDTLAVQRSLTVTRDGELVTQLNELEYIDGAIYANVYLTDTVVRIDPQDGKVLSVIDLSGLRPEENLQDPGEVLNGIAYDPKGNTLYVTGKRWAWLYEIRLVNQD